MRPLAFGQTFGEIFAAPRRELHVTLSLHAGGSDTPRHRHENDYICIVMAGAFLETSRRGRVEWRSGDAVFHRGDEWHQDWFASGGARCLNVHLPANLDVRLDAGRLRCSLAARSLAEALAAEAALERVDDALSSEALVAELVAVLSSSPVEARDGVWLRHLIAVLDDDPGRRWTLADLPALIGRHPTHVARAFRSKTGLAVGAYRRRRRITELCLRLRQSDTALAELAVELGYADQAHMNREFLAFAGISPGAYRRRR